MTDSKRGTEATEIEVEVVEIDGAPIDRATDGLRNVSEPAGIDLQSAASDGRQVDWRQCSGGVRRLDLRWWPLWVILGIIALALLLTVGLVIGLILLIIRLFLGVFRAVFR
jgi:hypothetical protein